MTLIIGIKYKEGVVLIGDTKIMDSPINFHHENKIFDPLRGIKVAVGCAGFTQLAKEFNTKINFQVQTRLSQFRLANMKELEGTGINIQEIESGKITNINLPHIYKAIDFLDDCAILTRQLADTGKVYGPNPLESLLAMLVDDSAVLYQIDCNGFKVEVPYSSIGSGTNHIGDYIKNNYRGEMSLYDAILLGTFLIKYVEVLEFDNNVGLEEGKLPQIFVVNKDKCENYKLENEEKEKILQEVKKRVSKIRKCLLLFPLLDKKIEKPIWGMSR